jgi:undecaprenyl-diphosphatase
VAFAALAVLAWPHARWRYPVLVTTGIIIFGVGFGRPYLGVHWPSDVLGGYLLGLCWLALALSLKARIGAKKGWI